MTKPKTTPVILRKAGDDLSLQFIDLAKIKLATIRQALVVEGLASSVSVWAYAPTTLEVKGFNTYAYTDSEIIDTLSDLFENYLPKDEFEFIIK